MRGTRAANRCDYATEVRYAVVPDVYEGEGSPGIILEAYAQGLPVIATRWHSIPEIVTEETGVLIEPKSVAELAGAMAQAMAFPESFASCAPERDALRPCIRVLTGRHTLPTWLGSCAVFGKTSKPAIRPKSVLVITQFHAPEPCAAANRVAALTAALAEAGFSVDICTGFASFPDGVLAASDRKLIRCERLGERVRLTRVCTYATTKISGRARIFNWFSVALGIAAYALFAPRRFDFVIVTMPPITLALPALIATVRHRAKLIVDVRDVFPDVAVRMGYWREGSAVVRIVGGIASAMYRLGAAVFCVTEAARAEVVGRGARDGKVFVAANGFDPIDVATAPPYRRRRSDEFVAVFVGNMGLATGLDAIVDAANLLRAETRIRFVLAGGGVDKERLADRIADLRLNNIELLGVIARPSANALLASADVSLVPLHPGIVDSLPTKMFDALVLGCPVICAANGEARSFIERSSGGLVVPPNDGPALAIALQELLANPVRRAEYAASGRAFVLEHFDRRAIMRDVATRLRRM